MSIQARLEKARNKIISAGFEENCTVETLEDRLWGFDKASRLLERSENNPSFTDYLSGYTAAVILFMLGSAIIPHLDLTSEELNVAYAGLGCFATWGWVQVSYAVARWVKDE